jgi:hypothetical protein
MKPTDSDEVRPLLPVMILSGAIQIRDVVSALSDGLIVVLETTRSHAKEIAEATTLAMRSEELLEGNSNLLHLSVQVPDRGWSHFLVHHETCEYQPGLTQDSVVAAVEKWEDAGSPDRLFVVS